MTTRILLVDDDPELRTLLCDYLARQGIAVSTLHNAGALQQQLDHERAEVVVLDVLMPGVDGLTALGRLRAAGDDIPVILLSGRSDDVDRIVGLEMGADDYISKPFNPREVVARVDAILRRRRAVPLPTAPEQRTPFAFGRCKLDFQTRTLTIDSRTLILSATEFALLKVFINHSMRTLTRDRLIELLYGPEGERTDRGVDVQVWRLRQVLEANPSSPRILQTVRGRGYVFVPDGEQPATRQQPVYS